WLNENFKNVTDRKQMAEVLLQAWWLLVENKPFDEKMPSEQERKAGWREAVKGRTVEVGWLAREGARAARYEPQTTAELGL
ncbi:MAG: proteasome subunit, partial [Verrucomicrobiales bacterium]|nr:proteasome subunit [Verrucomicrobiales bacterium]